MTSLVAAAAGIVAGTGVVLAALVLLLSRRLSLALPVLLDLLMAAGVLRLGADAAWSSIATAAAIVALRKVVVSGIHESSAPGYALTPAQAAASQTVKSTPWARGSRPE